jgi:predicted TIM-barrel fold metal-dependent hydrolase
MLSPTARPISVDDHLLEPPNLWSSRLPRRCLDDGPQLRDRADGVEVWSYAGREYVTTGTLAVAGQPVEDFSHEPMRYADMRPGCYDPAARIEDMNSDGVFGSLSFPTFSRFAGHRFLEGGDRELALLCVRAFNDFVLDEWCAAAPERLIPLVILPLWDVSACVQEIERTAARGARAVAFSENVTKLGLPSIHSRHWDPVFRSVEETDLALCMHIGSSSELITSSDDAPYGVHTSLVGLGSMVACSDFLFSHVFHSFPRLRVVLSEGGAGWVPYLLERADWNWDRHRHHAKDMQGDRTPSEIFRSNIWVCIISDAVALAARHEIGVDRMLWECDYPHADSNWPNSTKMLHESLLNVPADEALAIAELNARTVFRLAD